MAILREHQQLWLFFIDINNLNKPYNFVNDRNFAEMSRRPSLLRLQIKSTS